MQLGEYLKKSREAAQVTQKSVSDRLGYDTPQFVSNWERGVSQPPVTSLKLVAIAYKIPVNELYQVFENDAVERARRKLENQFKRSMGLNTRSSKLKRA